MPTWLGEKGLIMTQTLRGGNPPKYSINIPKGLSMKRFVIFVTVWLMGLGGLLAWAVIPSSASLQLAAAVAATPIPGSSYTPVPTARVFDGTATTSPRLVQIAGLGGVPANATAVMVNTEVSGPSAAGYVRVTPAGQNPGVATQEFTRGQTISNLVAVKLVGGKIQVKLSAGSARILLDVAGYYSPGAGASFTPLPTVRVFDGAATTSPRLVQIAGLGGVPANATAVMVNTEVSGPTAAGYVRVTPAGQNPGVATQEFTRGQTISNLVAVKLVGGKIQVKLSAGSARILMDVAGYYYTGAVGVTPPAPVMGLSATAASATSIALAWTNPTAAAFTGVTIRRTSGATAPATVTDGTPVNVPASSTATTYTDTGLTAGTQYSYAVFAHDGVPNYAPAATATATTTTQVGPDVTAPGPVTGVSATCG